MATLKIPVPLRTFTQNQGEVSVPGGTVSEVIQNLEKSYPGLGTKILDEKGQVRRYINIYQNDQDIRALQGLDTRVAEADKLTIMPAIAGGSGG